MRSGEQVPLEPDGGEGRARRGGPGWVAKVRAVLERCGGRCECGCGEPLDPGPRFGYTFEVDHVRPVCDGGSNEISNLRALKPGHHREKTRNLDRPRWMSISRPPLPAISTRRRLEKRMSVRGATRICGLCGHGMGDHRPKKGEAGTRACVKPVFGAKEGTYRACGCILKLSE